MGGLGVDAVADHEGVEQDEHAEQAVRLPVGVLGVIGARPSVAFGAGPSWCRAVLPGRRGGGSRPRRCPRASSLSPLGKVGAGAMARLEAVTIA
jgi:hypothetical protein